MGDTLRADGIALRFSREGNSMRIAATAGDAPEFILPAEPTALAAVSDGFGFQVAVAGASLTLTPGGGTVRVRYQPPGRSAHVGETPVADFERAIAEAE